MNTKIIKSNTIIDNQSLIILTDNKAKVKNYLSSEEYKYFETKIENKENIVLINRFSYFVLIKLIDSEKKQNLYIKEDLRKSANTIYNSLKSNNISNFNLFSDANSEFVFAFLEGILLSDYRFDKYITLTDKKEKNKYCIEQITIDAEELKDKNIEELINTVDSVNITKDLVNEPVCYLDALQLTEEFSKMGKDAGFLVEIFDKKKIETLKMGGLLAVNKGSITPPTFSILEWKPINAKNKKPIILVGKAVVYDTGGLSLKPTKDSMDYMKCDMAGGAAVASTIYAIAKMKLPLHIIALVPATDNRPSGNAYAPGDVIKMHNGMTVEMLNADAEGRMILADALSFAAKYEPELVISVATLTGAAEVAVGKEAIAAMGNADKKEMDKIKEAGDEVFERIAELPFWDEYKEQIKSEIADIKNIGGGTAGAITAGKFLEYFTTYPYIHLDIAGSAFSKSKENYRGVGATGIAVRLLFNYLKNKC